MTPVIVLLLMAASPAEQRVRTALQDAQRRHDSAALVAVLREETRKDPRFAPGWRLLGEIALGKGDVAGAREAFAQLLATSPASAATAELKATVQLLDGALAAKSPQGRDALLYEVWVARSAGALSRGDTATGAALAQRAVALVPSRPEAHAQLGTALELTERWGAAQREYALALQATGDAAWRAKLVAGLLRVSRAVRAAESERLAHALLAAGRQREAAWHLLDAFEAQPQDAQRGISAALALFAAGQKELAREALHHAEFAADPDARRTIAEVRQHIRSLGPVLNAESERLWLLARDACFASDAAEPLNQLQRAAKGKGTRYQLALAECLAARGELPGARAVLEKAAPTPAVWCARAALALATNRFSDAEQAARSALALTPSRAHAYRLLAVALAGQNAADASQAFMQALTLVPGDALSLSALAEWTAPSDARAALEHARKAVETRPWLADVWLARAAVNFRAGQMDAGKADSKTAAELMASAGVLRERLGGEP